MLLEKELQSRQESASEQSRQLSYLEKTVEKLEKSLQDERQQRITIEGKLSNMVDLGEVEKKLKKGVLSESNYTLVNKSVIRGQTGNESIASTVPDYADFKRGGKLNSTEAMIAVTPEVTRPSYLTPTASYNNRMFK